MSVLQRQGELLIARGVDREQVAQAWQLAQRAGSGDIVDILLNQGVVSPRLAAEVRAAALRMPTPSPRDATLSGAPRAGALLEEVPGYRLGRTLGQGGMGRVVLATDVATGAEVVIKLLLGTRSGTGSGGATPRSPAPVPSTAAEAAALERFEREARALAGVRHPNIVPIHRYGRTAEGPYLVMARIHGRSLQDLVEEAFGRGEPIDRSRARAWFTQLASALAALHESGVVHRDIKPDNLMIEDESDRLILVDLGLARRLETHEDGRLESLTRSGQLVGTPGYMAPEQLEKGGRFGEITPATDAWGLGAALYFTLTGHAPVEGSTLLELTAALTAGRIPRPSERRRDVDPLLESICRATLVREPSRRATVAAVEAAIRSEQALSPPRGRGPLIVLAGLLLVAAVLAGLALTRDTQPPEIELAEPSPILTRERRVELRGRVIDDHPALVRVDDRTIRTGSDGRFRVGIELGEGRHSLRLVASDRGGLSSEGRDVEVIVDRTAPTVAFDTPRRRPDGSFELIGRISEPGCQLVGGGPEDGVQGRRLRQVIRPAELGRRAPELVDPAGNRGRLVAPLRVLKSGEDIGAAIHEAGPGATLLIPPGRYRLALRGAPDIRLAAAGDGETRLEASQAAPLVDLEGGGRVELIGFKLWSPEGRPEMFRMTGGELALRDCEVEAGGRFVVAEGRGAAGQRPRIVVRGCRMTARQAPALKLKTADLLAVASRFIDGRPLPDRGALFEALRCLSIELIGCELLNARGPAMFLSRSHVRLALCRIENTVEQGIVGEESSLVMLGGTITTSGQQGALLENFCRALFVATTFHDNGSVQNGKLGDLRLTRQSRALLRGCRLRPGVKRPLLVLRASELTVEGCPMVRESATVRGPASAVTIDGEVSRGRRVLPYEAPKEGRSRPLADWIKEFESAPVESKRLKDAIAALVERAEELDESWLRDVVWRGLVQRRPESLRLMYRLPRLPTGLLARTIKRWESASRIPGTFDVLSVARADWSPAEVRELQAFLLRTDSVKRVYGVSLLALKGHTEPSSGPLLIKLLGIRRLGSGGRVAVAEALRLASPVAELPAAAPELLDSLGRWLHPALIEALLTASPADSGARDVALELFRRADHVGVQRAMADRFGGGPDRLELIERALARAAEPETGLRPATLSALAWCGQPGRERLCRALTAETEEAAPAESGPGGFDRRCEALLLFAGRPLPAGAEACLDDLAQSVEPPLRRLTAATALPECVADRDRALALIERLAVDPDPRVRAEAGAARRRLAEEK